MGVILMGVGRIPLSCIIFLMRSSLKRSGIFYFRVAMARGFKDSDGKFRPVKNQKGSRKKLDKSVEPSGLQTSSGIRMKRSNSNAELEKLFRNKTDVTKESADREFDQFTASITDFGSGDIQAGVAKYREVGLFGDDLADDVREFSEETGTPIQDIDINAVGYDRILQEARNEINSVLDFDIVNDIQGGTEFYVAGNFMATSYDYSQEAHDQLKKKLQEASKADLDRLSQNIFVKSFLDDVDIFR